MKIYNNRKYRLISGSEIYSFLGIDRLYAYLHGQGTQQEKDSLYDLLELHGRINYFHMTISII